MGVWDHFTKIEGGDPQDPRATCNYSQKSYACDTKRNGTSTLRHHLTSCKSYLSNLEDPNKKFLVLMVEMMVNVVVFWLKHLIKKYIAPHLLGR